MKATTLARTGPASVSLDDVEVPEAEPDAVITFRGRRVPVSSDAQVLPLLPTPRVRK